MQTWFEVKIRYDKVLESGMSKKVNEEYLVDAMSFTEAEARIIEEVAPFIQGEFSIIAIKRSNIDEIAASGDGEKWYKSKVAFITMDEKTGAEKETNHILLIEAENSDKAFERIKAHMNGSLTDYIIKSVSEASIVEVYAYHEKSTGPKETK